MLLFPSFGRVLWLEHIFQGTTQTPYLERSSGSLQQPEVHTGMCLFIRKFEHKLTSILLSQNQFVLTASILLFHS